MGKRSWIPPNLNLMQPNAFKVGLFDCLKDAGLACNVFCCYYCVVGDIADRLDHNGCLFPCLTSVIN